MQCEYMIPKSIHYFYFILALTLVNNSYTSPFLGAAGEGTKLFFRQDVDKLAACE